MLPYIPADDTPPKVDGEAGYHSPSVDPLLSPPPPPQPHSIQPIKMPPLTEERFMDAFMLFSNLTGIRLNEQDFFIEGHQVNPWELYRTVYLRNGFDSVNMNGEWGMVGVDLGFPPVSCGDPHPLAHCTPVVAHQLHQLYQDTLRHFDREYSRGIINQLECGHTTGQRPSPGQPLAYQPTEADYQALLSTITASESSSVMTFEEAKSILPLFCGVSAAELEAHRIPQHVIAYVEHNREYLKWLAQNPRFRTGFTPVGSPQFVHQNLFDGVQAIPRPSLHSPQNYPQLQQRRSDWESMHGDAMNLSLLQQQTIIALRAQVQQGNITHKHALDRLAMMQASSAHSFEERSAPLQLPPGFNPGGVPSDDAHQQMGTLSQHAQVSINDQMNPLLRAVQTRDTSHARQFNMVPSGQQQQNGSGITSHMGQYLNPSGTDLPQGPGSLYRNLIQPSPSVPHADPQPSSTTSASQISQPEVQQVSRPPGNILDVPLPQLRALSTQLMHVVMEGEKILQVTGGSDEGDIQRQQLRAKIELNKRRLRALLEVIHLKLRASGDPTQQTVNGPSWSGSGQRPNGLYPVAERPGQPTLQQNFVSSTPQSNLTQISPHVSANGLPPNSVLAQMNGTPPQQSPQVAHPPSQPPIQPNKLPGLSEDQFKVTFLKFARTKGIGFTERDLVIDGRPTNLWALHRAVFSRNCFESVTAHDEWPVVGVALGFPPVAGGDPGRPPRCDPAIAQRLQQLYNNGLRHFDQVYFSSIVAGLRNAQASAQFPQPPQPQAQAHQPTEADYQALLARVTSETSVMNSETMNILPRFSHTSGAELEARHVPQHVITFVEQNREHLQRAARDQNGFRAGLMGAQIPCSNSISGVQNQGGTVPVSMNPAAMNGVTSGSIFTQSPSTMQVPRLNKEDLAAAKRWVQEQKRMAFIYVPNFDGVVRTQSIPESDIQEYQRNLERLDQVLVTIEKYIHFAFAALKKEEVVERLFFMMASAKSQLEELKKPNPRYALELYTIRGMIQEADNMDKGLKAILQRIQAQTMPRDCVPSAPPSPPPLDSMPILPPPTLGRDPPQGDDSESALGGAISHREGLFDEEVRIAMGKLEI